MPKRKRVSRPHSQPKPPQRLITKARKQEWDEERRAVQPTPPPKLPAGKMAAQPATPAQKAIDKPSPDSPDLLALLTYRTKPPVQN